MRRSSFFALVFAVLALALLSGCATKPSPTVIGETDHVLLDTPANMYCDQNAMPAPPKPEDYLSAGNPVGDAVLFSKVESPSDMAKAVLASRSEILRVASVREQMLIDALSATYQAYGACLRKNAAAKTWSQEQRQLLDKSSSPGVKK